MQRKRKRKKMYRYLIKAEVYGSSYQSGNWLVVQHHNFHTKACFEILYDKFSRAINNSLMSQDLEEIRTFLYATLSARVL